MIYGLYLSATGVLTNSYRQDVIANNIANSETIGFKRDMALFQQRRTEFQERGGNGSSNAMLEALGGGVFALPMHSDMSQGEMEPTDKNLDAAIEGNGFFAVMDKGEIRLTRNGHFAINSAGHLALDNAGQQEVLDNKGRPIKLDPKFAATKTTIGRYGEITQDDKLVARIGIYDVPDPSQLRKHGGAMLSYPEPGALKPAASGIVHSKFLERGNVEPASELVALMDAQRQLEANANMIRYQDQTLSRLVNDVGKIS
jgi:flagellar basal-body rod protein FlgF